MGDAEKALAELVRDPPDLFTTDWNHPGGLYGDGLLRILAARKATFPIVVMTAYAGFIQEGNLLKPVVDAGLNVSVMDKPFSVESLRLMLTARLDIPC